MSTPINYGGPAFPVSCAADGTPLRASYQDTDGMSLRDWFAGQVDVAIYEPLQTLKKKIGRQPTIGELAACVAEIKIAEADAMLAAREAK